MLTRFLILVVVNKESESVPGQKRSWTKDEFYTVFWTCMKVGPLKPINPERPTTQRRDAANLLDPAL